jgi:integrase
MTRTHGRSSRIVNARSIAALKPRADRYIVRDAKVAGLELRVHPDGTKVWTLRYRIHGEQRRLKLGALSRLSLAKARARAQQELRKVDAGIDPQAERQAARVAVQVAKANSIEALCAAYIERHAKPKKRTWRDDQSKITCEILPAWKGRPVTSITRRDCRGLVQAIADRDATIYANRIAALLSRLFRFAVDEEIITANPAAHLPKPGAEAQTRPAGEQEPRPYTTDEIRALWAATDAEAPPLRALYRLGLITGQRPGEIAGMEWGELHGAWWTIPGRRTKNGRDHRVYLPPSALDALRDVPQIADEARVFVGYRGKRQLAAVNTRVFAHVRPRDKPRHALRDTVATGLAAAGVDVEDIARVLNHSYGPRVTAGYNAYAYDKEKRLAIGVGAAPDGHPRGGGGADHGDRRGDGGRCAMTPPYSFRAKDAADAERHLIACRALVDILQTDPRVDQVYQRWRTETGVAALIERLSTAADGDALDAVRAELLLTFAGAGVAMTSLILPPFVSKELRLPYPWLAVQLSATFQARIIQEATRDDRWRPTVCAIVPPAVAKGRRAKGGGDSIRRNVDWFYRVHIQEPAESVRALAREYSRTAPRLGLTALRTDKRKGDARAIVQEGIARAKALLDQAEYLYTPLPE